VSKEFQKGHESGEGRQASRFWLGGEIRIFYVLRSQDIEY
jgi:hypothetical protein